MSLRRTVIWFQSTGRSYVSPPNPTWLLLVVVACFTFLSITLRGIQPGRELGITEINPERWGDSRPLVHSVVKSPSSVSSTPKINPELQDNFNGGNENEISGDREFSKNKIDQKAAENLANLEKIKSEKTDVSLSSSLKRVMTDVSSYISDTKKKLKLFQEKESKKEKQQNNKNEEIISKSMRDNGLKVSSSNRPEKTEGKPVTAQSSSKKSSKPKGSERNQNEAKMNAKASKSISEGPITKLAKQYGPVLLNSLTGRKSGDGGNPMESSIADVGRNFLKTFSTASDSKSPMSMVANVLPLLMAGNSKQSTNDSPLLSVVKQFAPMVMNNLASGHTLTRHHPRSNPGKVPAKQTHNIQKVEQFSKTTTNDEPISSGKDSDGVLSQISGSLKSIIGNPRSPSTRLIWDLARQLNTVDEDVQINTSEWIKTALINPERAVHRNDIEEFQLAESGSSTSSLAKPCENVVTVGGKYNWTRNEQTKGQSVCMDPDLVPGAGGFPCRVLSFSTNDEWDFEEEMKKMGCKVWAFNSKRDSERVDINNKIRFYSFGLSSKDEVRDKKQFLSLPSIVIHLKQNFTLITYLKMDIGADIWPVLDDLINVNPMILNNVQQLGITVSSEKALRDPTLYKKYAKILRQLPSLGFHMFSSTNVAINNTSFIDPLFPQACSHLVKHFAYLKI